MKNKFWLVVSMLILALQAFALPFYGPTTNPVPPTVNPSYGPTAPTGGTTNLANTPTANNGLPTYIGNFSGNGSGLVNLNLEPLTGAFFAFNADLLATNSVGAVLYALPDSSANGNTANAVRNPATFGFVNGKPAVVFNQGWINNFVTGATNLTMFTNYAWRASYNTNSTSWYIFSDALEVGGGNTPNWNLNILRLVGMGTNGTTYISPFCADVNSATGAGGIQILPNGNTSEIQGKNMVNVLCVRQKNGIQDVWVNGKRTIVGLAVNLSAQGNLYSIGSSVQTGLSNPTIGTNFLNLGFQGGIHQYRNFPVAFSDGQIAQENDFWVTAYNKQKNLSITLDGDSITTGRQASYKSNLDFLISEAFPQANVFTVARSGSTSTIQSSNQTTWLTPHKAETGQRVATLYIGVNDCFASTPVATTETNTITWVSNNTVYGIVSVVCTLMSCTNVDPTGFRTSYNNFVRTLTNNPNVVVCDEGGDPVFGANNAYLNATLFPDGIHPSSTVYLSWVNNYLVPSIYAALSLSNQKMKVDGAGNVTMGASLTVQSNLTVKGFVNRLSEDANHAIFGGTWFVPDDVNFNGGTAFINGYSDSGAAGFASNAEHFNSDTTGFMGTGWISWNHVYDTPRIFAVQGIYSLPTNAVAMPAVGTNCFLVVSNYDLWWFTPKKTNMIVLGH